MRVQPDLLNSRNVLMNGPVLHAFDKHDRKFHQLSSGRSRVSENSRWILQVSNSLEEDTEVKAVIESMFAPGELENQFIKIYR